MSNPSASLGLPSIGVTIWRVQHECTAVLAAGTSKERQRNIIHLSNCVFVHDITINVT
jgi:hypothetical protein